ncbi:MAG: toxin-antitoxin system toxin component [Ignavibacteria bacterium]|nr:toxin-antitoxin system toxin component [Ignavibacteria bacterium]
MKYLIDTQILIWIFGDSYRIPKKILDILKNTENQIIVSAVSIWEIAIKKSIGKLKFDFELKILVQEIYEMNINILDITSEQIIKVADLPFHHKDPFDRLIISQAILENLPVNSSDVNFKKYEIELIW